MQIRVQDPAARDALATAFGEAGCPTLSLGTTLEVVHSDPVELSFFLDAWRLVHPDVDLEIEAL